MLAKMIEWAINGLTDSLKTVEYKRGGVAVAGLEVTHGQDGRVRTFARELASALAHEADTLQAFARQRQ